MFFKKKTLLEKINSDEYLELKKLCASLQIELNALRLDLDLYKKKLRNVKGLDQKTPEERQHSEDLKSLMLLPDNGHF